MNTFLELGLSLEEDNLKDTLSLYLEKCRDKEEKPDLIVCKRMVSNGADLNSFKTEKNKTVFHIACEIADPELLLFLAEAGAIMNGVDSDYKVPMNYLEEKANQDDGELKQAFEAL